MRGILHEGPFPKRLEVVRGFGSFCGLKRQPPGDTRPVSSKFLQATVRDSETTHQADAVDEQSAEAAVADGSPSSTSDRQAPIDHGVQSEAAGFDGVLRRRADVNAAPGGKFYTRALFPKVSRFSGASGGLGAGNGKPMTKQTQ